MQCHTENTFYNLGRVRHYVYGGERFSYHILPQVILRRVPYKIITKELDVPAFRNIGFALRGNKNSSLAVKRFLEYIEYRVCTILMDAWEAMRKCLIIFVYEIKI